jgi:ribosomal protein S12 methylthiotransferase accessory factor
MVKPCTEMDEDIARPRFKPHFHVEVVEPDTVYLLSEYRHIALRGRLYCRLARLLDGGRTVREIARELRGTSITPAIRTALARLERRGVLVFEKPVLPAGPEAFWTLLGVSPGAAVERLRSSLVSIHPVADGIENRLIERLEGLGVPAGNAEAFKGDSSDLAVVPVEDYLQPALDDLNRHFTDRGAPWMLLKPAGAVPWLGPIFVPGRTGCWLCLSYRLRHNRLVETTIENQLGQQIEVPYSRGALPSTVDATLAIASTEIVKWLVLSSVDPTADSSPAGEMNTAGQLTPLEGRLASLNLATLQLEHHSLIQRPQCPVCGEHGAPELGSGPIELVSRPKRFTADGGHRICTPKETVERLAPLVSPITGVVGSLTRFPVEFDDELVQYYVSVYPFLRSGSAEQLRAMLRHRGGGKGVTEIQARASALCESIERYSALFTDETVVAGTARFREVEDEAVHPRDLLHVSETQYRTRDEWNPRFPTHCWVPEEFDEDRAVRWTRVWSLTYSRPRLVPTAFAYFGAPPDDGPTFCHADSNGNAAGNCFEEAILQGLVELVERDCMAIWWYNRLLRPAVSLESLGEPYLLELMRWYEARKREMWVLDLTSDLGIPTFGALSRRSDGPPESITMGFGSHLDARIAVLRAVTELNQSNVLCRAFGESPGIDADDPLQDTWMRKATVADHPYLAPARHLPALMSNEYPQLAGNDLRTDIETCVEILRRFDLEVLVLDQTQRDLELCAVKVISPGLRGPWHRLAPGRLYEAPVRLGWTTTKLREGDLNPLPLPL